MIFHVALVPSPYEHPHRNGRSAKKTMFLIDIQSGTVRYYFQRNLIYKKILSRIFLPLLFRDSTYYMGIPREVSEYGHFVFLLPIIEEPCSTIGRYKRALVFHFIDEFLHLSKRVCSSINLFVRRLGRLTVIPLVFDLSVHLSVTYESNF